MKADLRFRILAFVASFVLPLLFVRLFPRVDLLLYDEVIRLSEDISIQFKEILGPSSVFHCSLVLLGERELSPNDRQALGKRIAALSKSGDLPGGGGHWALTEDSYVARRLLEAGARAVVLSRGLDDSEERALAQEGEALARVIVPSNLPVGATDLVSRRKPGKVAWEYPIDADGSVRRVYLALRTQNGWVATAPLVLFADFHNLSVKTIEYTSSAIHLGKVSVPVEVDEVGLSYYLHFYENSQRAVTDISDSQEDSRASQLVPASLQDLLDPNHLLYSRARGRYFFIGSYLVEAFKERVTPGGKYRDFQLLAVALDSLIQNYRLRWLTGWPCLILLALWECLAMWLLFRQRTGVSLLQSFALLLGLLGVTELLLLGYGVYLPGVRFGFGSVLLVGAAGFRLWASSVDLLHRFGGGAAAVAASLGLDGSGFADIDDRTATILFVNLPDHLKDLERINSPDSFLRRKEFSAMAARVCHDFSGIIHDYQADALMIGFGTDVLRRDPEHAYKAVCAASALHREFAHLSAGWLEALDSAALKFYSGLCTGEVAVGFVGAREFKKAPAAIGDTTNVAARLLGAAKKQHVEILVSKLTRQHCGDRVVAMELPPVALKGKTHPVEIFQITAIPALGEDA